MPMSFRLHRIALVSAAICCSAPASAEQGVDSSGSRAHLDLVIKVPAVVRAEMVRQPRTVTVRADDLAKGYVDERGSVVLTSNANRGYRIFVRFDSRILSKVEIRLQDQVLDAAEPETALRVFAPRMLKWPVRLEYRFYLAPGTKEGVYAWPTRLDFAPSG